MNTTITTLGGKKIVLTASVGGVTARAPAMGVDLGPVDLTSTGFQARFAQILGGKRTRVEVALDAANLAAAKAVFADAAQMLATVNAEEDAHEAHRQAVLARVNQ